MERLVFIHIEHEGDKLIIPETMDSIRISHDTPPQIHNIVALGPRTAPSYRDVKVVTLENTIFHERWIEKFIEGGLSPRGYADKLTEWRDSLKPSRLVLESEIETYNMNILCFINFKSWEIRHMQHNDIYYNLTMWEHIEHDIGVPEQTGETGPEGETIVQPSPKPRLVECLPPPKVYEVVRGDSLTKIARRHGQPDSAWMEIYKLNKDIIHARGNQDLIFPGQNLVLPDSFLTR